ncbi:MAG: NeuD/PglB/VioB family sugar acetyltransferase [Desulfobaccales bacterium]
MDMTGFFRAWRDYCRERQVVSELVRFHPLLGNFDYCRPFIPAFRQSPVVVMDLTQGPEAIWKGMSPSCRNKIRKAQKHGVKILVDENFEHLDTFHRLYIDTMQRVGAREYYYFSRPWFDHLVKLFQGQAILVHALLDDRIIASSLFLFARDFGHYFLSGSNEDYKHFSPNNLLIYESSLWFQRNKFSSLNLGGGVDINDSLFYFKSSFSLNKKEYFTGHIIPNTKTYNILSIKESHIKKYYKEFFPIYRFTNKYNGYQKNRVAIIGASGHGKVCLDILQASGWPIIGYFDDNFKILGNKINGIPVLGTIEDVLKLISQKNIKIIIAIGNNYERCKIYEKLLKNINDKEIKGLFVNAIHPSAIISSNVEMGCGNFIAPGAIINSSTKLGSCVIINTGATIDHDNIIHDFAQISPGCNLAGNVTVEEGAFLGTGAVVIPGKTIGAYSIIGAGTVVIHNIPPYCTAVGVPARVIKRHDMIAKLCNVSPKS